MNGLVVVDKPRGVTSHDAVNKVRRYAGTRKVGHLGTLDPMATGVLPLLLNRATRLAQFFTRNEKAYEATVRFGFATDSYDADGARVSDEAVPQFSREELEGWLNAFRSTFQQIPPAVSAKKIGGVAAYKLARKNLEVSLAAVEVTITRLEITRFELPEVDLRIECTAGTYVRSLAHDAGVLAGCGAHLIALRRSRSGSFSLEHSRTLADLATLAEAGQFDQAVIPASQLLPGFEAVSVDALTEKQIRDGRDFRAECEGPYVRAISGSGELVAIGKPVAPGLWHPEVVL